MNFGEKLRLLRNDNNLTQCQLANRLGMTTSNISYYESNSKVPPADIILRLSRIFNVTTDYLLDSESPPMISLSGLNDEEMAAVKHIVEVIRTH